MAGNLATISDIDKLNIKISNIFFINILGLSKVNLRSVDLNLLTVFDAVYSERSMSRAAEKIGMSQPALSLAISRFRHIADDELFERTGRGVKPTPRAEELSEPVRRALLIIREALTTGEEFDADRSDRVFTVMLGDYGDTILLPQLIREVASQAPNVRVQARRLSDVTQESDLYFETVDLVLWLEPLDKENEHFVSRRLGTDTNVCVARHDHPCARAPLTWESYAEAQHAVIELPASYGPTLIDRELWSQGLKRRSVVTVSSLLLLPDLLASTDVIATVPQRIANRFLQTHNLRIVPSPINIETPIYLSWHKSQGNDPGHRWFRDKLLDAWESINAGS